MAATRAAVSAPPGTAAKSPVRAAVASLVGSTLEYYDYMLYASAAGLVFPHVFFPSAAPGAGLLLSFATYGVSYVARPFGAFVFGTIGDRFGRKALLQTTILLMGAATLLTGLIPSYHSIGVAAPIILVLLRIVQGLSTSAEAPGGYALTIEHAPDRRRAFYSSWTMSGVQGGQALASLAFIPVAALPANQLYSWGWRIPFLLSALVVLFGYLIRRTLSETPEFSATKAAGRVAKHPALDVIRHQWPDVLRVLFCSFYAVVSSIATVFGLAFATNHAVGVGKAAMLWAVVIANVVAVVAQPAWGALADRIGRKAIFAGGALASAALLFAYFDVISSRNTGLVIVVAVLLLGIFYSAPNGVSPALYGEMFDRRVRTVGMAVGMQLGLVIYGFAPTIGQSLTGGHATVWLPVAVLAAVAAVAAAISALTARETFRTPLADIDRSWA